MSIQFSYDTITSFTGDERQRIINFELVRLFRIKGLEYQSHIIYSQRNILDRFVLGRIKDTNKDINLITLAHIFIGFKIEDTVYISASKL